MRNRLLTLVLAVLLLVPVPPVAQAARPDEYPCLHPDMTVSANGEVLSKGTEVPQSKVSETGSRFVS